MSENNSFINSGQIERRDDKIDELDSNKRNDNAADTVDEQVALQRGERADGSIFHAAQRQGNERNNDERIEDHGAEDRAGRTVQPHDVQRRDGGESAHQHGGGDWGGSLS